MAIARRKLVKTLGFGVAAGALAAAARAAGPHSPWPLPFAPPAPASFVGFIVTMAGSDFSRPCTVGFGSSHSRRRRGAVVRPWSDVRSPRFRRDPFVQAARRPWLPTIAAQLDCRAGGEIAA